MAVGDGAGGAVVEHDGVVRGRRIEAEAVDGDAWYALAARSAVLVVTTGVTVATCTAAPLLTLSVVTTAVRLPAVVGLVAERHGERSRGWPP